jgi:hypothetical protein
MIRVILLIRGQRLYAEFSDALLTLSPTPLWQAQNYARILFWHAFCDE